MNKAISTLPIALALSLASPPSDAVVNPGTVHPIDPGSGAAHKSAAAPSLEVVEGPTARAYRLIRWDQVPRAATRAWQRFLADASGSWRNLWDFDTGVPSRIYGAGMAAPGSVDHASIAERHALDILARHIDLLAPGAHVDDFQLVSNHLGNGMRTVGFHQYHQGMRVLGGQVSFRFKADRMFVIGSEALPHVRAPVAHYALPAGVLRARAVAWIADGAERAWTEPDAPVEGPFILPVVARGGATYHTVVRVTVEARAPIGRWHVFLDANTGLLVAREQLLRFGQGVVEYNAPERYPGAARNDYPAQDAMVQVAGGAPGTDFDGVVTWNGTGDTDVTTSVLSDFVVVTNRAGEQPGELASTVLTVSDGGSAQWNEADNELVDAQLSGFIHARIIKEFARTFAPDLPFLDEDLPVNVNINDSCNAFSDGNSINFFTKSSSCENTARLADVVYHEFGHSLHAHGLIEGVGAFDGAFSEGLSDYLSAAYTRDPGMGRGFFFDFDALRHIDPVDMEHRWPDDIGEVHYTGLIFAGAMWDLRKSLIATYGIDQGAELANKLFYAAVQRAVDTPTTYVEVLAADDDDGDLSNGTPNECAIKEQFGALHGLRSIPIDYQPLGLQAPEQNGYDVSAFIGTLDARCPGDTLESAVLEWGLRDWQEVVPDVEELRDTVALTLVDGLATGTIPQQPEGSVVRYRFRATLADGSVHTFPDNRADTAYEFYVGEVVELYCHDFETDPFSEDWTSSITGDDLNTEGWEWGTPAGKALDPLGAYAGTGAIGTDLGLGEANGVYLNLSTFMARTPVIVTDNYSDVRLQYRRWLTVEDAFYDRAEILANGTRAWRQYSTPSGVTHHLDGAWMFHDVPLSQYIFDGSVQLTFELESDFGLQFGGWNMDELCVVANPAAICGDGEIVGVESCDNGAENSNEVPNACRTNCQWAFCGDSVVDDSETCDDGNRIAGDGCNSACLLETPEEEKGCACRVGNAGNAGTGHAPGALLLGLLGLLFIRRRRRKRGGRAR